MYFVYSVCYMDFINLPLPPSKKKTKDLACVTYGCLSPKCVLVNKKLPLGCFNTANTPPTSNVSDSLI